jgi:hypothetical protein
VRNAPLLALAVVVLAGCGGAKTAQPTKPAASAAPKVCAHKAGWQRLANRIQAPVYCPNWLPDPLVGEVGGRWNNIDSVSKDRSYLEGFVWQETGPGAAGGELHVNLRGYPGSTEIPVCEDTILGGGKTRRVKIPCFSDAQPPATVEGYRVTEYRVNQGADQWHVLYAWTYRNSLYTVSEHVAPPVTFSKAKLYLAKILRNLVRVEPARY